MLGNTVKVLRKERAWSQVHLAEAAGVSVRTIQRVEREGQCSGETLLSLAAAFDVDVQLLAHHQQALLAPSAEPAPESARSLLPELDPKRAARWGAALATPSLLFILSNVLKYIVGVPHLYDLFAALGDLTGLSAYKDVLLSPVLLLGGPVAAVLLNLLAQVRVSGEESEKGYTVRGLNLSFDPLSSLILVGALVCFAVLLGYATMENLADWVSEIANR